MSQRCAHTFYPWLPVPPPWGNYPCLRLGEWIEVLRRHCAVSQGHKTENWLGYDLNQESIWPMAHPLSINIHHAFPFCRDSLHQQQLQHNILMTLTSKALHSQGDETKEGSCLPSSKRVTQTSDTHSQPPHFLPNNTAVSPFQCSERMKCNDYGPHSVQAVSVHAHRRLLVQIIVTIVITVGHACLHLFTPALGSLSLAEQNLVTNFNGEL